VVRVLKVAIMANQVSFKELDEIVAWLEVTFEDAFRNGA
jgi:hypothetical protein